MTYPNLSISYVTNSLVIKSLQSKAPMCYISNNLKRDILQISHTFGEYGKLNTFMIVIVTNMGTSDISTGSYLTSSKPNKSIPQELYASLET